MQSDAIIPFFVSIALAIVLLSAIMKRFKQPAVVAYLLVGFLLGPSVFTVIHEPDTLNSLGNLGVILLLFFVGMEVSPKQLMSHWFVSVFGALLKVVVSFVVSGLLGYYFHWPMSKIVLVTFIISLSSTAIVLKLLQDWKELETHVGQNILGILLIQDLLVIPMLIILGRFGGSALDFHSTVLQVVGGILAIIVAIWVTMKPSVKIPFIKHLAHDAESQIFSALIICFGLALLTTLCHLSSALGAFLAGLIVSSAKESHWVHQSLSSLRTLFMAFFFVSVGMLVDIHFLWNNLAQISILVFSVIMLNTLATAFILKMLGSSWRESLYGGSLLSQIGEFAFILSSIGYTVGIVNKTQHQMLLITITLSLFLSPLWIFTMKRLVNRENLTLKRLYVRHVKRTA